MRKQLARSFLAPETARKPLGSFFAPLNKKIFGSGQELRAEMIG
jgi:hypothetical protein